jgi:hypothetical protein
MWIVKLALSRPYRFVMLNTVAESPGCAKGTTVSGANRDGIAGVIGANGV